LAWYRAPNSWVPKGSSHIFSPILAKPKARFKRKQTSKAWQLSWHYPAGEHSTAPRADGQAGGEMSRKGRDELQHRDTLVMPAALGAH